MVLEDVVSELVDLANASLKVNFRFVKNATEKLGSQKNQEPTPESLAVATVVKYLFYFNSLPWNKDRVFVNEDNSEGEPMSDIEVFEEWAPFIYPKRIRFDVSDTRCNDLLIRPKFDRDLVKGLSHGEFLRAQNTIRSKFRASTSEGVTNLGALRVEKSFNDIINHAAFKVDGDNVYRDKDPFIPIPINVPNVFWDSSVFNYTADKLMKKYLEEFKFVGM